MGYFNTILFFVLFGTLISPDLKAQNVFWYQSEYLELSESEAAQYTLCQPDKFNHWYLVASGEDLSRVISGIKASLEGSSSAEGSSSGSGSASGDSGSSSDTLTPVSPGMPEPVTTDNRLLLILPAFGEPYTISKRITLENEVLGLCTQPKAEVPNQDVIPWEEQAVISLTDDNFDHSSSGDYAIGVNNHAELYLNSVVLDASEWSLSERLINIFGYKSKAFIHHSTLLRKKTPPMPDWGWVSLITVLCYINDWGECPHISSYLEITDSRLYQGMSQSASDLIQVFLGVAVIRDTQLVLSQHASRVVRQSGGNLDIIGGTVSTCSSLAVHNPMDCFKEESIYPLPKESDTFTSVSRYPLAIAVYNFYGQLNVQQVIFRGYWYHVLALDNYYTFKINGPENTGNRLEDIYLSGSLCWHRELANLEPLPPGAIELIGYGTCPNGTALAPSQISADNGDYPDLTPPSWLTDSLASDTPTPVSVSHIPSPVSVTHTSEFSDPPHNHNGANSVATTSGLCLLMTFLASHYSTRGL